MECSPWIRRIYVVEMPLYLTADKQNGYNLWSESNPEQNLNGILFLEINIFKNSY